MPMQVVNGAKLQCSFGTAPSSLTVLPVAMTLSSNQPAATIMDHKPMLNVMPFGMCTTPTNPQVAAATAAALGVLTPQPCIPMTTSPWMPGSMTVLVGHNPALNNTSVCMCMWAGVVSVMEAGQATHQIP